MSKSFYMIAGLAALGWAATACSRVAPPPPPMPVGGGPSWPIAPARLTPPPTMTLDPTLVPPFPRSRVVAHAEGFKSPESILHDPQQDIYFVTNVNGPNDRKDNNGFVSRVHPDGSIEQMRWVSGGTNGVTLHAPKGMALTGDT